jgi:hypothetical protein
MTSRLRTLLTEWRDRWFTDQPPPPPDQSWPTQISDLAGDVVDVVVGRGYHRIVIVRDEAGLYRLQAQTWAPDWGMSHDAAWFGHGHIGSVCDSLTRAQVVAKEALGLMGEGASKAVEQ